MKIRFQADESLSHALIQAVLRLEPSIEFTTAQEAGALGLGDPEVLALVITHIFSRCASLLLRRGATV